MKSKLFILLFSIITFLSCEKQCFEGYVFHFKATNNLTTTEIQRGDSIIVTVEIPEQALSSPDSQYYPTDNFDFTFQVNFKKYVSSQRFNFQQQAFNDFDYRVLQGKELTRDEVSNDNTLTESAIYLLLDKTSPTREVIFSITPRKKGIYFIHIESEFNWVHFTEQNVYDEDDCFDQTFYDFYNATKNDYSFLEGEIQDTTSGFKTFIKNVAGLAFMVYE